MTNSRILKVVGVFALWLSTLAPAHAQPQYLPPIYFAATQEAGGQPVIKFIFSKRTGSKQQFEPTHGFRISPNREQRKCNTERTDDLRIPAEYSKDPLYDSDDPKSNLPIEKLPVFFATVVSAELTRKGLTKTSDDSLPYHTCTRLFWEQLLGLRRDKK